MFQEFQPNTRPVLNPSKKKDPSKQDWGLGVVVFLVCQAIYFFYGIDCYSATSQLSCILCYIHQKLNLIQPGHLHKVECGHQKELRVVSCVQGLPYLFFFLWIFPPPFHYLHLRHRCHFLHYFNLSFQQLLHFHFHQEEQHHHHHCHHFHCCYPLSEKKYLFQ